MKIKLAFRMEPGGDGPELVAAVDEYTIDAWGELPDFYVEAIKDSPEQVRQCWIEVSDRAVAGLFSEPDITASLSA